MTNKDNEEPIKLEAIISLAEAARLYSNCSMQELRGLEMSTERTKFEMSTEIYSTAYQMGFAEGRNYAYNTLYNICLQQSKLSDKEMTLKIAERRLRLLSK